MKQKTTKYLYDETGESLLEEIEVLPFCGEFCHFCGECIVCNAGLCSENQNGHGLIENLQHLSAAHNLLL